jgi:hypothetical protein
MRQLLIVLIAGVVAGRPRAARGQAGRRRGQFSLRTHTHTHTHTHTQARPHSLTVTHTLSLADALTHKATAGQAQLAAQVMVRW